MSDPAPTPSPQKSRAWIFSGIGVFVAAILVWLMSTEVDEGSKSRPPAPTAVATPAAAPASTPTVAAETPRLRAKFRMGPLEESNATLEEMSPKTTLSLGTVTTEEVPDENAAKHLRLHVPIRAQKGLQIDLHELVIHVFLYDQLDGKDVVETAAKVNTHWAKPPVTWEDSDVEELIVDYDLPKPDRAAAEQHDRQYYGYVVRVYYQQQLQASAAQPESLAQRDAAKPSPADDSLRISPRRPAPTVPPVPPPEPMDLSETLPDIAAGSAMGILPITSDEIADPKALQHFLLHIPIKVRPKVRVDVKDLMVQVLFYDRSNGNEVVPTCANVKSRWDSPPADWTHTDVESLNVEYQLLRPPNRSTALDENRQYYGYIVRLYYRRRLQACVAQPPVLTQKYPTPPVLEDSGSSAE